MKKIILSAILAGLTILLTAQMPQKMSYQAVIRNAGNQLAVNTQVGMRISILQGSITGIPVYVETHTTTTNSNGLATIEIGAGAPVSGTFSGIDWSSGSYFIKTESDPSGGVSYTITGTSQLLAVPYALYAGHSADRFSGQWNDISGKPAFAAVATSGSFSDLLAKPTTLSGYGITDADNSNTNEIQTLSIAGSNLSLSNGGGTVSLPATPGDNWGSQAVVTDASLSGGGTTSVPLAIADNGVTSDKISPGAVTGNKIAQSGATSGQVLKWNGSTWAPGNDINGNLNLPFSGAVSSAGPAFQATNQYPSGIGIYGVSDASSGNGYGVFGESKSPDGMGVRGVNLQSTGYSNGVYGQVNSPNGYGVEGNATSTSGATRGVIGKVASTGGIGVQGIATASSGTTYGVIGQVSSPNGVSGYFDGGRLAVNGKVGIGIFNPYYQLEVVGDRIQLSSASKWIAMRTDGSTGMVDLSYNGKLVIQGTAATDDILLNPALASKVGIRTWAPMYDLDVTGNIRATGSVYYGATAGVADGIPYSKPDYVFEEEYNLIGTGQVEEFIMREKHLPWITSAAKEKEENGEVVDMTRMAFETVETAENLQLQIIEMDKKIKMLSDLVFSLQQKIESIKGQDK